MDWDKYRIWPMDIKELANRAENNLIPLVARDTNMLTDEEWDILEHYEPKHRLIRFLLFTLGLRQIRSAMTSITEDMGR